MAMYTLTCENSSVLPIVSTCSTLVCPTSRADYTANPTRLCVKLSLTPLTTVSRCVNSRRCSPLHADCYSLALTRHQKHG
jgi:hypothetical protein